MTHRVTRFGEIVNGDDPPHPDVAQRREILTRAFQSWGWEAEVTQHGPQGRFVKFTGRTHTLGITYTLETYIFPNLADSARGRPHEKRIQLTRPYEEHRDDFELGKSDEHRCLLLGIYRLSQEDVVICAWDAAAYRGHAEPTSCYVNTRAIAGAFRVGLDRSQDNKGRYVFCFRPEFIHYYIENMAYLHKVDAAEAGIDAAPDGEDGVGAYDPVEGGENVIYYGAPGTGKTHTVDRRVEGTVCVRTVFHPDMQNSDFVGSLKPVVQGDRVSYAFAPGPFALALKSALRNPERRTYLVIEELNRAPAAAVFGDLFLLLDRDERGAGKYDVDVPTPEFRSWLFGDPAAGIARIALPANLWILATMNSADQGVYPIDTAFRRRWRQVYVPIDYDAAPDGMLEIRRADDNRFSLQWRDFVRIMNEHLTTSLSIAEDRLIGPWFATAEELAGSSRIPGKVLIYLWDDLLRHHGREMVFNLREVKTYGQLYQRLDHDQRIFSDELLDKLAPEPAEANT